MFCVPRTEAGLVMRFFRWIGLLSFCCLHGVGALSAPSYQSPIPLHPEEPLRLLGAITTGVHAADGVGLSRLDAGFGFTHQATQGLEWGVSAFGGLQSDNALFKNSEQVEGHTGLGLMGRMLGPVTRALFMGLQLECDYNHSFHKDKVKRFAGLDFKAGLPIGYNVVNLIRLYVMPQLLLDRLFYKNPNSAEATLFSSLRVGVSGQAGMRVLLGSSSLLLAVEPGIRDPRDSKTFYTDFLIGLSSDL